jgi:serine protease Do
MNDALRTKLNLILVALLAFALGLGFAAKLDLTPQSFAIGSAEIQFGASEEQLQQLGDLSLSQGFAPVVEKIGPAVVTIRVARNARTAQNAPQLPEPFRDFFRQQPQQDRGLVQGSGSGFIVSPDGYIVTNNHVVSGAEEISVELADRREFVNVQLVGRDPDTDVALLKIDADDLPSIPFGSAAGTRVGEWVLAIGSPGFSAGAGRVLEMTVTAGIVSAKGRNINILARTNNAAIEDFIQTDAAINPGNSGGPLVNVRGEVIGMNTAISSTTGFNQGYGFAVPIELVGEVVDDLIQYGEVRRAILGVSVTSVTAEDAEFYGLDEVAGVVVQDFGALGSAQSAARDAGLERGDVIVSLEGAQISTVSELQTRLRAFSPGETVTIGLIRRSTKERHEIRVELQQRPAETRVASAESPPDAADHLGISVRDLEEARSAGLELDEDVSGVIISDVSRTGALGRSNIQPGLIIQDINGQAVNTVDEYHEIVQALQPGGIANLALLDPRSGSRLTLSVRLPS